MVPGVHKGRQAATVIGLGPLLHSDHAALDDLLGRHRSRGGGLVAGTAATAHQSQVRLSHSSHHHTVVGDHAAIAGHLRYRMISAIHKGGQASAVVGLGSLLNPDHAALDDGATGAGIAGASGSARASPIGAQSLGHVRAEGVHGLVELGEPVHHVAVVAGNAPLVALGVADDHPVGQGVEVVGLAQHGGELHRLLVDLFEIALIGEGILTDFKADVGIVGISTSVPPQAIPGQGLDGTHASIGQLADKGVSTHIQTGVVPVVGVAIAADGGLQGVPVGVVIRGLDIACHQGVVGPGGVDHNSLGGDGPPGLVAVVIGQITPNQVHFTFPPYFSERQWRS